MRYKSALHWWVAVSFALAGICCTVKANENNRPITGAKVVLAIYTQSYGLSANGLAPHELIFAAWEDGYVVWSENVVKGGIPYRAGKIDPARLKTVLRKTHSDGLLKDQSLSQPRFGPSSRTTILLAKSEGETLKMQSWHELYEEEGKVVATAGGLATLKEQTRFDVLRKEPADYLVYRLVWEGMRLRAASLIPAQSTAVDGKLELRRGNAYWMETLTVKP